MPLDDVDEQNGALFFLPGSHKFIERRERDSRAQRADIDAAKKKIEATQASQRELPAVEYSMSGHCRQTVAASMSEK